MTGEVGAEIGKLEARVRDLTEAMAVIKAQCGYLLDRNRLLETEAERLRAELVQERQHPPLVIRVEGPAEALQVLRGLRQPPVMSPPEPDIVVNGVLLSEGQAMTVRVALTAFQFELTENAEFREGLGKIGDGIEARTREVLSMMVEKDGGRPPGLEPAQKRSFR